jgi:hypothetical protein
MLAPRSPGVNGMLFFFTAIPLESSSPPVPLRISSDTDAVPEVSAKGRKPVAVKNPLSAVDAIVLVILTKAP